MMLIFLSFFMGTQLGTSLPFFFFIPIFSYPSQHGSDLLLDGFFLESVVDVAMIKMFIAINGFTYYSVQ